MPPIIKLGGVSPGRKRNGVEHAEGVVGHGKAESTLNVYIQPIEASVKQTLGRHLLGADNRRIEVDR